MRVHYLEIVSIDPDATCSTLSASLGAQFGEPVPALGNARTAPSPDGGMVGVRAPMHESEQPVVRPYWLVDDINGALASAVATGAQVAHPPMELPDLGTFAIFMQDGTQQGLWQV
ncbi:hydroxylase [Luteimonas vadosa]|uniref:Hydroxylase n=1 Tax=Luteimonas vadosa TaxID=1165507 RepID=A0ABP9DV95_9GAMM